MIISVNLLFKMCVKVSGDGATTANFLGKLNQPSTALSFLCCYLTHFST